MKQMPNDSRTINETAPRRGQARRRARALGFTFALLGAFTSLGCQQAKQLGQAGANACNLTCAAEGVAEGNAAISGIQSVDAFFGAVLKFQAAADLMTDNVAQAKARLALSVGLPANTPDAQLKAALTQKFAANVDGGLSVRAEPPECKASVKATIEATARCDAEFDPGSAEVKCEGSCTAEAGAQVQCDANAEMICHGTAPQLSCSGSCTGSCELQAAAQCDGVCRGTCEGKGGTGQSINGQCDGQCKGECELEAGGQCNGKCKGECAYKPGSAGCSADAKVECKAQANASVACKGSCDGDITPPKAKAECEAAAKAEASADVECTPPRVALRYRLKGNLSAAQRAEFEAWLTGFSGHYAELSAEAQGRGRVLLASAGDLAAAARGAVSGSISALKGNANLRLAVGAGCALGQLEGAARVIGGAQAKVQANVASVADLMTVVRPG